MSRPLRMYLHPYDLSFTAGYIHLSLVYGKLVGTQLPHMDVSKPMRHSRVSGVTKVSHSCHNLSSPLFFHFPLHESMRYWTDLVWTRRLTHDILNTATICRDKIKERMHVGLYKSVTVGTRHELSRKEHIR